MRHSRKILLVTFVLGFLVMATSGAAIDRWKYLGSRKVNHLLDHDTIPVTAVRGDFRRIRIHVSNVAVNFHRVVVHYGNGAADTVEMRMRVPAGGYTRAIDLRGTDRVIRSVDFWYDTRGLAGRHGIVTLYGMG